MQSAKRDIVITFIVQQPWSTTGQFPPVSGKQIREPHQLDSLMTAKLHTGSRHQHHVMLPSVPLIRTKAPSFDTEMKGILGRVKIEPWHLRQRMQQPRKSEVY